MIYSFNGHVPNVYLSQFYEKLLKKKKKKDIKMLKQAVKMIKFSHGAQPRGEKVG